MRARCWAVMLLVTTGLLSAPSVSVARAHEGLGRVRVPWPVFVGTSKGRFLIRPSGAVTRLSSEPWRTPQPHIPPGWLGAPHGPFGHLRDGHVVLTQRGRTLWKSRNTFGLGNHAKLSDFSAWNVGVTFQVRRRGALYAAMSGRPEVRVGRGLFAEGITRTGRVVTLRPRTRTLQSWRLEPLGAKTLARHLSLRALDSSYFDRRTGTFLYWTPMGDLVRTDGLHREVVANYHPLGFLGQPAMYLLHGGLVELLDRTWHEVVLRADGSVFARASAPSDGSVAGFGDQTARRDGRAVAYALTPVTGPSRSTVFLLREGATRGQALYSGPGSTPCALAVSWREEWVLFAPTPVILDSIGAHAPINLRPVVRAIPGQTRMLRWAYRPHGPGSRRGSAVSV